MSFRSILRRPIALLVVVLALVPLLAAPLSAAPLDRAPEARLAQLNVDWMTADQAASLDLDFAVLVPSWIPAPFGGAPSIQASGGYYSLYWMIPGGDPTFLQITGEVGGAMPVGSPADLNVRLEVNASVNGYEAIHDATAIYDNVWWVQGGVLYTVSSKNMTGADSLSLASSLIALQQPAAEPEPVPTEPPVVAPTPTPEPATSPTGEIYNAAEVPTANVATIEAWPSSTSTLRATHGAFVDSGAAFLTVGGGAYSGRAPSVERTTTVEFTLVDDATGEVTAWSSIVVYPLATEGSGADSSDEVVPTPTEEPFIPAPTEAPPVEAQASGTESLTTEGSAVGGDGTASAVTPTAVVVADAEDAAGEPSEETTTGGGGAGSDGTGGPPMPRDGDGTAGPSLPAGGDGTGGIRQLLIP